MSLQLRPVLQTFDDLTRGTEYSIYYRPHGKMVPSRIDPKRPYSG